MRKPCAVNRTSKAKRLHEQSYAFPKGVCANNALVQEGPGDDRLNQAGGGLVAVPWRRAHAGWSSSTGAVTSLGAAGAGAVAGCAAAVAS